MILRLLWGAPLALPSDLAATWPELSIGRFRHGGLPLWIASRLLGGSGAAGVTLGRTVWLAKPELVRDAELLLHEIRHVQQFSTVTGFPCRYLWESLVRGYHRNRFEVDARAYAARRRGNATIQEGAHG